MKITFKSKPVSFGDHERIKPPVLTRRHCDMAAFRRSRKYGGLANSDLFPSALAHIAKEYLGVWIDLRAIPPHVTIDQTGFLAVVTLNVPDV